MGEYLKYSKLPKGGKKMAQGKRYAESAKLVDRTKLYSAKEALEHKEF